MRLTIGATIEMKYPFSQEHNEQHHDATTSLFSQMPTTSLFGAMGVYIAKQPIRFG